MMSMFYFWSIQRRNIQIQQMQMLIEQVDLVCFVILYSPFSQQNSGSPLGGHPSFPLWL